MNKTAPDPPRNSVKDRAAFNRTIDHYLPSQGVHIDGLIFEGALLYTASLLKMAKATVDRSIECLNPAKTPLHTR